MANEFNFNPVNGLLDTSVFPSDPVTEEAARGQFMILFNQLKDFINIGLVPLMLLNEKVSFEVKSNGTDFIYKFPLKINGKEEIGVIQSAVIKSGMANVETKTVNYLEPFKTNNLITLAYIESVEGESPSQYSGSAVKVNNTSFTQTIISRLNDNVFRNVYCRHIAFGY